MINVGYSSKKHQQISHAICLSGITPTGRTKTPPIPRLKAVGTTLRKIFKLPLAFYECKIQNAKLRPKSQGFQHIPYKYP